MEEVEVSREEYEYWRALSRWVRIKQINAWAFGLMVGYLLGVYLT
jgi:hypothetical protein